MKTATGRFYQTAIVLVASVLLLGTISAALAQDGLRIVRTRPVTETRKVVPSDTGVSATPQPVADETPINPESAKTTASSPASDTNRSEKRTTVRR